MDFEIKNDILKRYRGKDEYVIIPDGVKQIGKRAFYDLDIKCVVIPESITSIGEQAFYYCSNLESVLLSDNITEIGKEAFAFCLKLKDITLPKNIKKIEELTFFGCQLERIVIPEGVTEIKYWAFDSCKNLDKLVIGNHIHRIESDAFCEDASPRHFIIAPDSEDEEQCKMLLDSLGTKTFAFAFLSDTLKTNTIIMRKLKSRIMNKRFREKYIPQLIEDRETGALSKMLTLVKKMTVEEIDGYIEKAEDRPEIRVLLLQYKDQLYPAEVLERMLEIQMEKDFGLREKTLADYKTIFSIKKENDVYIITKYNAKEETVFIPGSIGKIPVCIGDKAFSHCKHIVSVHIGEGVTKIGDHAFFGCSDLQNVIFAESVTHIGLDAFRDCENLQEIHIPDAVKTIAPAAFSWCIHLQSITLPNCINTINPNLFYQCKKLSSLFIPKSVTHIGSQAFFECKNLTILCEKDSFAQKYAELHFIPFKTVD